MSSCGFSFESFDASLSNSLAHQAMGVKRMLLNSAILKLKNGERSERDGPGRDVPQNLRFAESMVR
jgi:hypothetical protein